MLINDLVALLMRVPPMLAGAWAAWFFVGLMLSIWQRRESARLIVHGPSTRNKSGVRPRQSEASNLSTTAGSAGLTR